MGGGGMETLVLNVNIHTQVKTTRTCKRHLTSLHYFIFFPESTLPLLPTQVKIYLYLPSVFNFSSPAHQTWVLYSELVA